MARHAVDTGELDVSRTEIGGDSVDLGGFRQYVHRREASRRVEWSAELDVGTLRGQGQRLLGKHKSVRVNVTFGVPLEDPKQLASPGIADGHPLVNGRPWVVSYEIEAGSGVVLRLSRRPDGTMHLDRLDTEYMEPLVAAVLQSYTTAEGPQWTATDATMRKVLDDLIPTLRFTARGLLPDKLLGEEYASGATPQLVPIQKAERLEQLVGAVKLFVPRGLLKWCWASMLRCARSLGGCVIWDRSDRFPHVTWLSAMTVAGTGSRVAATRGMWCERTKG